MRLAASNEPSTTDHTGEIISFSDIGPGGGASPYTTPPRPWICYTTGGTTNVEWQFPDRTTVPAGGDPATGDQLITRVGDLHILSRGPTHNSPDGEHCCVRTTSAQSLCVTFSEWSEL